MHGNLSPALEENVQHAHNCQWLGIRSALAKWQALTKDTMILQAIAKGVRAPLHSFPKPSTEKLRTCKPHPEITKTIGEYLQSQAIRLLNPQEIQSTNYWVPVFGREKKDSEKVRLITDLRDLNNCHEIQQHKPQTWKQVVDLTQDNSLTWGVTLDLKAYYHHLQLHSSTARWIRFKYQDQAYQAIGMPFGWSMAPFWSHRLAKPIRQRLQEQGIPHAWFVDDVLILGRSAQEAAQNATYLVKLLTSLGIQINKDKSMKDPAQQFTYLGHNWDLQNNKIHPIQEKITKAIKAVKHQIKGNVCTAKHMASLAGMLLDQVKSNVALWGLPKQLMRSAGHIVAINKRHLHHPTLKQLWHTSLPKRYLPYLPELLLQSLTALQHPTSIQLRPNSHLTLILQTDASDQGWGASLIRDGKEIANCAQHWTPDQRALHITHREGLASALAVHNLQDHIPQNCSLSIQADATSTVSTWNKGSKIIGMNKHITPELIILTQKGVLVRSHHIAGKINTRSDYLSRQPDAKNYRLHPAVFREICTKLNYKPNLDQFANRHNKQMKKFCSWWVDRTTRGNTWEQN